MFTNVSYRRLITMRGMWQMESNNNAWYVADGD